MTRYEVQDAKVFKKGDYVELIKPIWYWENEYFLNNVRILESNRINTFGPITKSKGIVLGEYKNEGFLCKKSTGESIYVVTFNQGLTYNVSSDCLKLIRRGALK